MFMSDGKGGEVIIGVGSFVDDTTCRRDSFYQRVDTQLAWVDEQIRKYEPEAAMPVADAGTPDVKVDAKTDAAPAGSDARRGSGLGDFFNDAGPDPTGGSDAATDPEEPPPPKQDAGSPPRTKADAGTVSGPDEAIPPLVGTSGGCSTGGPMRGTPAWLPALALIALLVRRRR
jgi:MYXO-CTERM domain-containing protein